MLPFAQRLLPAPRGGGFRDDAYWTWCGSAALGEDGRWHLFAARWPRELPFFGGYLAASEIVRAVADDPLGPYAFAEVVLPDRGAEHWDGRMTHNPHLLRVGDAWWLFYIGATYDGPRPTSEDLRPLAEANRGLPWYRTIRIGVATAPRLTGPWTRPDQPALDVNPDGWDHHVTTNPSPCLAPDGRLLLYYRSGACQLGLAAAASPGEPFRRVGDRPVVQLGEGRRVEDPFVWWNGDEYEMLAKDLVGNLAGEFGGGVHLWSPDGLDWRVAEPARAYSRTVPWDDGTSTRLGHLERPFVLMRDGAPAVLFAAAADGPGPSGDRQGWCFADRSWTTAIPLTS